MLKHPFTTCLLVRVYRLRELEAYIFLRYRGRSAAFGLSCMQKAVTQPVWITSGIQFSDDLSTLLCRKMGHPTVKQNAISAKKNQILERSWGFFWASWAVLEASWAILAALVASQVRLGSHLGHLGRIEERQGRVWAPTEPREEAAVHAPGCGREGGALRR